MRIDVSGALEYVRRHFSLSDEAIRMVDNLFNHINETRTSCARELLLDVLDGFGFEESDLDRMVGEGLVRTEPGLAETIDEIASLQKFLCADPENRIVTTNRNNVVMELSMTGEGCVYARCLKSSIRMVPDTQEFLYDGLLSIPEWRGIIKQLKAQPCEDEKFGNRWEEIQNKT